MPYHDFVQYWRRQRRLLRVYTGVAWVIMVLLIWVGLDSMPFEVAELSLAVFLWVLSLCVREVHWFKRPWVVYTQEGEYYVREETFETFTLPESQEVDTCREPFGGEGGSDEMTS